MNMDNVQLQSEIEETVPRDNRVSRNQIKTRSSSFQSIYKHWRDYRSTVLNQKLNNVKDDLVRNMSTADYQEIRHNNDLVSKLEEKIEILSKSDVPSKYIKHRAIKLREKMMNSVYLNSAKAYAEKVFASKNSIVSNVPVEDATPDFIVPPVVESMAAANTSSPIINVENVSNEQEKVLADEIDRAMGEAYFDAQPVIDEMPIVDEPINRNDIEQVVENAFTEDNSAFQPVENEPISRNEIEQVVENAFAVDNTTLQSAEEKPISREEIEQVVENTFDNVEDNVKVVTPEEVAEVVSENHDSGYATVEEDDLKAVEPVGEVNEAEPVIDYSHLKEAVDQALADIQFTQNDTSAVSVGLLPPHVEEPFEYKPMTDEEIAKARENIEYQKYEDIYAKEWAAKQEAKHENAAEVVFGGFEPIHDVISSTNETPREDIVVVPDRKEINEKVVEKPVEKDLHFDYSEATESDLVNASKVEESKMGLSELKERALKLKEQNRQSKIELDAAKNAQIDEARKALEIRNANLTKKLDYVESLRKLREFCDSLEEDTQATYNSVESARNNAEANKKFIQSQYDEISDYDSRMKEIESIISGDDITKRR